MNNTHPAKYLTRGALAVAFALSMTGLTGCSSDDEPRTVTTSQTTETTEVRQPGMGATTTETRTYQQQ